MWSKLALTGVEATLSIGTQIYDLDTKYFDSIYLCNLSYRHNIIGIFSGCEVPFDQNRPEIADLIRPLFLTFSFYVECKLSPWRHPISGQCGTHIFGSSWGGLK